MLSVWFTLECVSDEWVERNEVAAFSFVRKWWDVHWVSACKDGRKKIEARDLSLRS